ncbi:MAG: hypothetical protein KDA61_22600 [Planctomycetales bacterium]|nr:hypothetical protein [Planctomycetales bacterium]
MTDPSESTPNPYEPPATDVRQLPEGTLVRRWLWRLFVAMYVVWSTFLCLVLSDDLVTWVVEMALNGRVIGTTQDDIWNAIEIFGFGLAYLGIGLTGYVAITSYVTRQWKILLLSAPCLLGSIFYAIALALAGLESLGWL